MTTKKATPRVMRYARYYYNYFFKIMGFDPIPLNELFIGVFITCVLMVEFFYYLFFIY